MKISQTTGLVGFLLALSALNLPKAEANTPTNPDCNIEQRLSRISALIHQEENQLPDSVKSEISSKIPSITQSFLNYRFLDLLRP